MEGLRKPIKYLSGQLTSLPRFQQGPHIYDSGVLLQKQTIWYNYYCYHYHNDATECAVIHEIKIQIKYLVGLAFFSLAKEEFQTAEAYFWDWQLLSQENRSQCMCSISHQREFVIVMAAFSSMMYVLLHKRNFSN